MSSKSDFEHVLKKRKRIKKKNKEKKKEKRKKNLTEQINIQDIVFKTS